VSRFIFLFSLLIPLILHSQSDSLKYRIQLTDKNNNGFDIQNPAAYLSNKAIDRRNRQGIPIQWNDMPLTESYVDSIRALGATILNRSKWFNTVTISTNDTNLIKKVHAFPFVKNSGIIGRKMVLPVFNEKYIPLPSASYKLRNDYGPSFTQIGMLNGDFLHDLGYQGEGMTIAVIDAGFYKVDELAMFTKLRNEKRILGTRDFVKKGNNVYLENAHGTAVLSTIAGYLPGKMVGTAPNASFWLLRSEDVNTELLIEEDNWVAAAEFADSAGVDIISTSLSYTVFDDSTMDHSYSDLDGKTTFIARGAGIAASKGMLVVVSAGNYGNSSWRYIGTPADNDSVLTVGAVGPDRQYASFSSTGPTYDQRIKPNVMAHGKEVVVASFDSDQIRYSNGTSFSCPIISGMAACLWQANPFATGMEIFQAIEKSSDRYDNPDTLMGHGIPNFIAAHYDLQNDFDPIGQGQEELYIYPNPFVSSFNILFNADSDEIITLEFFDALGQKIMQQQIDQRSGNKYHINSNALKHLQAGPYFLRYTSKSGFKNIVLIKVK
jgi:serine protease AprX